MQDIIEKAHAIVDLAQTPAEVEGGHHAAAQSALASMGHDIAQRLLDGSVAVVPTVATPGIGPSFPIDSHQLRCLYDWASHDHDAAVIQLTSLPDGTLRATQGDESDDFTRLDHA